MSLRRFILARQDFVPGDSDDQGLGGRVTSGSAWSGVSTAAVTALQFVRSIIFARLLMPADFGVISIANVLTYFILIFANFGFNSSVIYHRNLRKEDLATCWWGNLGVDFLAALACVVFAFGSRRFVNSPEVPWVIALLALQFLLVSVGSINAALLRRAFRFKKLAVVNISGSLATLAVALLGVVVLQWGVYGLVAGIIAGSAVMSLLQFVFMPWLPSLSFSGAALKKHVRYGRWFLGVNLVNYTNNNIDKFWIGTLLNSTQLGFYEYATSLPIRTCTELSRVISNVFFPAYSSLQNNFTELRRVIVMLMRYSSLLVYPVLIGLAIVAEDFVIVAYGDKWRPIIAPMQVFCLIGLWRVAFSGLFPLCYGVGKPSLPFKWSLIGLPVNAFLLYWAVRHHGVLGVAIAKGLLDLFLLATLRTEIMRHVGLPLAKQLRALLPALSAGLIMALPLLLLQRTLLAGMDPSPIRLLLQVGIGAVLYPLAVMLLWRRDFHYLRELPKRLRGGP